MDYIAQSADYIAAVNAQISEYHGDPLNMPIMPWITETCPECGGHYDDIADDTEWPHGIAEIKLDDRVIHAVIIGCEGYHVVNPAVLGIESNWSDWTKPVEEQ